MSIGAIGSTSAMVYAPLTSSSTRPAPPAMSDTAKLLGISTDQLSSDLQSGQTLSSLASTAGVSSSDLLASVETDMTTNAPAGAAALSSSQLQRMATGMINGTGGPGGPGGPGGAAAPSSIDTTTSTAQSLSSSLGVDPSTLLAQVQRSGDLTGLLQSAGVGYGSSTGGSLTAGWSSTSTPEREPANNRPEGGTIGDRMPRTRSPAATPSTASSGW